MGRGRRKRVASLLADVATALEACRQAGLTVRLRHDTVFTDVGYVLDTGDAWVSRTLAYLPFDSDPDPGNNGRDTVWPPPSTPSTTS